MAVVSPRPLPNQPTVIVLRALPGLGDWLCAEPTIRALRAGRPDARIHLVALGSTRDLIRRYDGLVDGFHAFPGWPGLPERPVEVAAIPGFLAALQNLEADLAIQLHGSGGITNELIELFGARDVAGFFEPGTRCPDPVRFIEWRETEPEVRRGLRLLSVLGVEADDLSLAFPLDPAGRAEASRLLADSGATKDFVVLHPGSNHAVNRWPPHAFAAVGCELARHGIRAVVTGGVDEMPLTRVVASSIPGAIDLGGRTTLDTLGWVVRSARLVVANDTGVAHVADALRVPSVVVFANDDGRRAARWAPLDPERHSVVVGMAPGPSVAAVVAAVLGQLGRGTSSPIDRIEIRSGPVPRTVPTLTSRRQRSRARRVDARRYLA